jgi:hypothetical protein
MFFLTFWQIFNNSLEFQNTNDVTFSGDKIVLAFFERKSVCFHCFVALFRSSMWWYNIPRNKFNQILPNRIKIKYNLNPKIHTRSCVYTSIDNEARKKITRLKYFVNCPGYEFSKIPPQIIYWNKLFVANLQVGLLQ